MEIQVEQAQEKTVVLRPKSDAEESIDFSEKLYEDLKKKMATLEEMSVVLDFSKTEGLDLKKILLFSSMSATKRSCGKSFVVVSQTIDVDDVPEELNVVPTVHEALDVIEMEDIERDLGI